MKNLNIILLMSIILLGLGLTGCGDEEQPTEASTSANSSVTEVHDDNASENNIESNNDDQANDTENAVVSENDSSTNNHEHTQLSNYSNEQIEYARIWLQLGPNQDIDELYVHYIPAGEPVNPTDDTSVTYPEDVIQLSGTRLVDGSVTYSGNGDGTINVYNVPLRWESSVPEDLDEDFMKDLTQSIIDDTESVYVDPGNDEDVIALIQLVDIDNHVN